MIWMNSPPSCCGRSFLLIQVHSCYEAPGGWINMKSFTQWALQKTWSVALFILGLFIITAHESQNIPPPPYARYFFISTTGSTAQLVTGCMISMVSANQIIMWRQTQPQTSSECENNLIEGIQGCAYVKCTFPLCCWTAQCHVSWLWWDQQVAMTTGTQVEKSKQRWCWFNLLSWPNDFMVFSPYNILM